MRRLTVGVSGSQVTQPSTATCEILYSTISDLLVTRGLLACLFDSRPPNLHIPATGHLSFSEKAARFAGNPPLVPPIPVLPSEFAVLLG